MKNKILVVEDDPNILEALKYYLTKEGYDTLTSIDGAQAMAVARAGKPDLIILDIMLPEMSGFYVKKWTSPLLCLRPGMMKSTK